MATILRLEPREGDLRRWTIGLAVSSDCRRLSAALVTARGRGMDVQPEIVDGVTTSIPGHVAGLFDQLTETSSLPAQELAGSVGNLRAALAELQSSTIDSLLRQAAVSPGKILAIGVCDPGLWSFSHQMANSYLTLCDAARLAETTGMNVIDALPARDVARGGQGGPLAPLAEWALLRHPTFNRLLVDLGRTARISYLPRTHDRFGSAPILSLEVGPGTRLIDFLAQRFSNGEHSFDPGGRFAVQGQRIEELLDHWLSDPYFRRPLPRWHPRGVRPDRFLIDAMQMAVEEGWAIRDLLCTATHFVADAVSLAVRRRLPEDVKIDEVLVSGGGQQNGMLLREIGVRFPRTPLTRVGELGIQDESLGPACVAILALFHLDQVPANRPEITGADVGRVLGRLTPGSPQSWQRLLAEMGASRPDVRPLRSAL